MTLRYSPVTGVLLAGGLGRRMGGGDKPLKTLAGRPILDLVIERARSQVNHLVLNVNSETAQFEGYGLPMEPDVIEGYAGPLAGILTGLEWTGREFPDVDWMVSFPTDAPFFPLEMVECLMGVVEKHNADMACAMSNGRTHPVFALWPVRLVNELRAAMVNDDMRKIDRWTAQYDIQHVDFAIEENGIDPFFNINRPEDLAAAETWAANMQETNVVPCE